MAYGSPGVARAEEREDAVHAGEEEREDARDEHPRHDHADDVVDFEFISHRLLRQTGT